MQQVTRKTLGAGINLTCVTTPKFKRAVLRTMLVLPLGGEDAALRACLPQVLRRGTARLNDMQAFGTAGLVRPRSSASTQLQTGSA